MSKTNNSARTIIAQSNNNVNERNEKNMKTTNTFATLLRTYEKAAINADSNPTAYADSLQALGQAVTLAVLKKCINASANKALVTVRNSLYRDIAMLKATTYANESVSGEHYNENGDLISNSSEFDKILSDACGQSFGDGMDLVHTAIMAILEETEMQKAREGINVENWLEKPYSIRRVKDKVRIQSKDSKGGFITVETVPIKEVYRKVRKEIYNNKSLELANNGFTYLEDIAIDSETGIAETIYRRYGKYADIGGYVTDCNGKETVYTADKQTVDDMDKLIGQLELNDRQGEVLKLRLSGYGYKAIGTYLGITKQAVAKTIKRIQGKALDLGLTPVE